MLELGWIFQLVALRKSTPIQTSTVEVNFMHGVRVVKREEREAANNLAVVDQTTTHTRMTPELVVKGWITATRERRQTEMKALLLDFKRPQDTLCLVPQ